MHRRNASERAIQEFKNHFIAGIFSIDPNFPLRLWDRFLSQATITLNMLRQSSINPMVSAYSQLYGHYDFNQAQMAPPGTRGVAHEKPHQRACLDPHGVDGWYLGPAPDHYRCYRVHINKTKADRIVDTVAFFPAKVTMPHTASKDLATIAAQELTHALLHSAPAAPFSIIGGAQLEALRQLALSLMPPSLRLRPMAMSLCRHRNPHRRVRLTHPQYLVQGSLRIQPNGGNPLVPPLSAHGRLHLRGGTQPGPSTKCAPASRPISGGEP
jgi:hypothetical protein